VKRDAAKSAPPLRPRTRKILEDMQARGYNAETVKLVHVPDILAWATARVTTLGKDRSSSTGQVEDKGGCPLSGPVEAMGTRGLPKSSSAPPGHQVVLAARPRRNVPTTEAVGTRIPVRSTKRREDSWAWGDFHGRARRLRERVLPPAIERVTPRPPPIWTGSEFHRVENEPRPKDLTLTYD